MDPAGETCFRVGARICRLLELAQLSRRMEDGRAAIHMMSTDHEQPGLVRFWFEFDLEDHRPPEPPPGAVSLDGGTTAYRWLSRGAGVTGYDQDDCLRLISGLVGDPLPPLTRVVRDVDVQSLGIVDVGVPSSRGVWFPPVNRGRSFAHSAT